MSKTDPNEPAFPRTYSHDGHNGITIRDYFAAKAMQGWVTDPNMTPTDDVIDSVASFAYRMADAMIKARETE